MTKDTLEKFRKNTQNMSGDNKVIADFLIELALLVSTKGKVSDHHLKNIETDMKSFYQMLSIIATNWNPIFNLEQQDADPELESE
jgi:hypothetical protein